MFDGWQLERNQRMNHQEQRNHSEEALPDDVLREERLKTLLYNTDYKIGEWFDTANLIFSSTICTPTLNMTTILLLHVQLGLQG